MPQNVSPEHEALLKQQSSLARFGELALRSESLDEILAEACQLVADALGTELAKVLELQEDGRTLLVKADAGIAALVGGELRKRASHAKAKYWRGPPLNAGPSVSAATAANSEGSATSPLCNAP